MMAMNINSIRTFHFNMKARKYNKITKNRLDEIFLYLKGDGAFLWKKPFKNLLFLQNRKAGTLSANGYIRVRIDGEIYSLHRLIYFYETGSWPEIVDHINGVKTDNRINNLRASDYRKNQQNRYKHRKGKLIGTSYNKKNKNWTAQATYNGKTVRFGSHKTEQVAHEAYLKGIKFLTNGVLK